MSAHRDKLLGSNKGLEPCVEGLAAFNDRGLPPRPGNVLSSREKLFHEFVLRAHCHMNNPILRGGAHTKWVATVEERVERHLGLANGHKLDVTIHGLAGCAIHDDMDSNSKLRRYQVGIAANEVHHFCFGKRVGNL